MTDDMPRASRAQQLWWTIHRDNRAGAARPSRLDDVDDVIVAARRLRVPVDAGALERCLGLIARRHEALRTGLVRRGDRLFQRIAPEPSLEFRVLDRVGVSTDQAVRDIHAATRDELRRELDLEVPRYRAVLARLAADDNVLIVTVLHSLFDDFSHQLLVGELRALYTRALGGPYLRELPAPVPFRRFTDWQRDWQRDEQLVVQREYWCRKLDSYRAEIALPVLRPRSEIALDMHRDVQLSIAPERWKAALGAVRGQRATPFALVVAVLSATLAEYAGQDDIAIATVYGNRRLPWTQSMIGLVANTLVVRTSLASNPTLRALVAQVARDWLDALAHGEFPFDELAHDQGRSRLPGPREAPAYDVLVNFHVAAALTDDDRPSWMQPWPAPDDERPSSSSGCLLYVTLWTTADGALEARFRYPADRLSHDVVAALATRFQQIVAAISDLLDVPAARLGAVCSAADTVTEPRD